jgi:N-acetylneuraminic acid mutarotase
VVGGYASGWKPIDSVFEYNPDADRWRQLAPLPTPRGALTAGVIEGKIHAIGGVGTNRQNTATHEVYDPGRNAWESRAALPTPRDHLSAAVVDGRLYAIGGRKNGSYARNLNVNEAYDAHTDRWETRAPMPTPHSGISVAILKHQVYVFGGEAPEGTFDEIEIYDPETDRWSSAATRLPTARHGLGTAVHGGRIFVIAGGTRPGGSASSVNEIYTPVP